VKINIDWNLCEGHGQCVVAAPEVFDLPDDKDQVTVLDDNPPEGLRDKVERAAMVCPMTAITIED
jgi:ferredoxin